jgi:predicted RNase H-like HicB family nuclease
MGPGERYSVSMRIALTAVYEPDENGWTQARIEELPAVITAGSTLEEAKELLFDALREYLLSLGEGAPAAPVGPAMRETFEIVVSA